MAAVVSPDTLNVLVGAVIALIGTGIFNWNQRRVRRNNLRRVLILEIVLAGASIFAIANHRGTLPKKWIDPADFLPSDLYEANLDKLQLLSANEIEAIFQFYTTLSLLRSEVGYYEPAPAERVAMAQEEALEALGELRKGTFRRGLRGLLFWRYKDAYET